MAEANMYLNTKISHNRGLVANISLPITINQYSTTVHNVWLQVIKENTSKGMTIIQTE